MSLGVVMVVVLAMGATDAASLVAYKRALRYLRSRGLEPLTDAELKARGDRAARVLSGNC